MKIHVRGMTIYVRTKPVLKYCLELSKDLQKGWNSSLLASVTALILESSIIVNNYSLRDSYIVVLQVMLMSSRIIDIVMRALDINREIYKTKTILNRWNFIRNMLQ